MSPCPDISDVNSFRNGESIVHFDAEDLTVLQSLYVRAEAARP
jgi:hypothetical protein